LRWCALNVLLVPYAGLLAANLQAGETVLISGATGNFGSAGVAVALAMGAGCVVAPGCQRQFQQIFARATEDFACIGQHARRRDVDDDLAGPQSRVGRVRERGAEFFQNCGFHGASLSIVAALDRASRDGLPSGRPMERGRRDQRSPLQTARRLQ
jgi:hypothetical protein